jgi:SAM-dependent methyltransferase
LPPLSDHNMSIKPPLTSNRYLIRSFLSLNVKNFATKIIENNGLNILDIGCGLKPYEPLFKKRSKEIFYAGIDLNSCSAADAIAIGENIPFKNGSFKYVLCTQALEHTIDPAMVVTEILRVLETDGSLLISTHGIWIEGHEPSDMWRWTRTSLIKMLQSNGFKVKQCFSMPPTTSAIQILLLYIPEILPLKYTIIPFLNTIGVIFGKVFKEKGPKIHVVHVIEAYK